MFWMCGGLLRLQFARKILVCLLLNMVGVEQYTDTWIFTNIGWSQYKQNKQTNKQTNKN